MELQGKIINVLPLQGGTSKAGNEWKKCTFILETQDSQFPRKVAIIVFGSDRIAQYQHLIQNGEDVRVSVDIESREFNGRWYTDVNAWKIEAAGAAQAAAPVQAGAPAAAPSQDFNPVDFMPPAAAAPGQTDDLPF